jgi:hypothetical protein
MREATTKTNHKLGWMMPTVRGTPFMPMKVKTVA